MKYLLLASGFLCFLISGCKFNQGATPVRPKYKDTLIGHDSKVDRYANVNDTVNLNVFNFDAEGKKGIFYYPSDIGLFESVIISKPALYVSFIYPTLVYNNDVFIIRDTHPERFTCFFDSVRAEMKNEKMLLTITGSLFYPIAGQLVYKSYQIEYDPKNRKFIWFK